MMPMDVKIEAPRYILAPTADGVRVEIPAPRNWFAVAFLSVWLTGWFFGARSALAQLFALPWGGMTPKHDEPGFLAVWLLVWTAGGVAALSTLLWQVAGREIITANALSLSRRIEALGFGVTRSYALSEIRDLRATPSPRYARQRAIFPWTGGEGSGSIAFDYGARTIRCAAVSMRPKPRCWLPIWRAAQKSNRQQYRCCSIDLKSAAERALQGIFRCVHSPGWPRYAWPRLRM